MTNGEHSQFRLLRERRFAPFFGVQFLGAMNDNVFKQALVILLAYQTASFTSLSSDVLQNVAQALFILPFFLFSATAGQLADKFEKSRLISVTVAIELAVMALGAVGFFMRSLELLLAALFLGGVQSALFGPVKYAILPQQLKETELVGGNGLVEMGTSIAILLGMVLGGWMVSQAGWGIAAVAFTTMGVSAAGLLLSRFIPLAPAADPDLRINWNLVSETWRNFQFMRGNRTVFLSILGISWFWFFGAMFVTQSRRIRASSRALAHPRRSHAHRDIRRLLHRAAPRDGAAQRRRGGLYLHAGARVPHAVPGMAAHPLGVPAGEKRPRQHSRRGPGGGGVQPRELCGCPDSRGGVPAPDPVVT